MLAWCYFNCLYPTERGDNLWSWTEVPLAHPEHVFSVQHSRSRSGLGVFHGHYPALTVIVFGSLFGAMEAQWCKLTCGNWRHLVPAKQSLKCGQGVADSPLGPGSADKGGGEGKQHSQDCVGYRQQSLNRTHNCTPADSESSVALMLRPVACMCGDAVPTDSKVRMNFLQRESRGCFLLTRLSLSSSFLQNDPSVVICVCACVEVKPYRTHENFVFPFATVWYSPSRTPRCTAWFMVGMLIWDSIQMHYSMHHCVLWGIGCFIHPVFRKSIS